MNLEKLSIALRPRNSWEAIDLGLRLALKHVRPLYGTWFALTLPAGLLSFLILGLWLGSPSWAIFFLWWMKPAFDRIVVHILARAVFGEASGIRSTLKALPSLLRSTGLLRGLTIGRLSLCRSVSLPVDVLEGLRGRTARERKAVIGRRISGAARWQTLAWLHLEFFFWLGCAGLLFMLIPHEMLPTEPEAMIQWLFVSPPDWLVWAALVPFWLGNLLLEPLYVAGGFTLYLKRRTDLEAWDIELQFRQLSTRHRSRSLSGLAACFLGLSLICASLPTPSQAQESAGSREVLVAEAPKVLKEIMKAPEFGQEESQYKLHWRSSEAPKKKDWSLPEWLQNAFESLFKLLASAGEGLGWLGRVGAWAMIAIVVAAIFLLASRFSWRPRIRRKPPAELAGFDIRPESLPDAIPGQALALLGAGRSRDALSLLFRGSLSRLAHQENLPFSRGDTEGDCLNRIREFSPARTGFMARLLKAWQRLAYAHREIDGAEIEALCREWWAEFGRGEKHV